MPYIFLSICQFIGQTFYDFLRRPYRFHGKSIQSLFCFFFQKLHCQHKKKKLIKHQSFSRSKQFLHIFRKMYSTYRKIIICQLITFPDLFWQIFGFQRPCVKNLMNQLRDCLIGKPFGQCIHRLHTVNNLFIRCRGKNFWMFHLQTTFFTDNLSA